ARRAQHFAAVDQGRAGPDLSAGACGWLPGRVPGAGQPFRGQGVAPDGAITRPAGRTVGTGWPRWAACTRSPEPAPGPPEAPPDQRPGSGCARREQPLTPNTTSPEARSLITS